MRCWLPWLYGEAVVWLSAPGLLRNWQIWYSYPRYSQSFFFSLRFGRCRTRLGPYNCVSNEKRECTRTRVVQKLWQIITKPKTNKKQQNHQNQKRPANPPARFAFRLKAKHRSNKERGRGPTNKTHSDLP